MIGDDVEITIVEVKGERVRIGINAPRAVQVHRKEIYQAIQAENAAAAVGLGVEVLREADATLRERRPNPATPTTGPHSPQAEPKVTQPTRE